MPETTTVTISVTDTPKMREFIETVAAIRSRCWSYDEASGNLGDVERLGDELDEALEALGVNPPTRDKTDSNPTLGGES